MRKNTFNKNWFTGLGVTFLLMSIMVLYAQQQDVPETAFVKFSIQPAYVPTYHGRDPFRYLFVVERSPQISIAELNYCGVMKVGDTSVAMFSWKGNNNVRYTLKARKLYGGADQAIDGVVGDITDSEVILIQGDQKVIYSRNKK